MPLSNTPPITLADLQACLPADWHATLHELAATTLQATTPLKLSLVGAFSVGKSSLLNMLMNDPVLQASLEETTALPTFIEYGAQRAMQLVGQDGSITALTDEAFAAATTHAPEGAACPRPGRPGRKSLLRSDPWVRACLAVPVPDANRRHD